MRAALSNARREQLYARAWPKAKQMLYHAGIRERDIAAKSGIPLATVSRALSLAHRGNTGHHAVIAVRRACEQLLPTLSANHWEEYDLAQ